MNRKEVKRLLKEHPEFSNWVKKDPVKMSTLRSNPKEASKMLSKWQAENQKRVPMVDFEILSEKSRRASQMLGNIQNVMEMLAEYSKKGGNLL